MLPQRQAFANAESPADTGEAGCARAQPDFCETVLSEGVRAEELARFRSVVFARRRVSRGDRLFHSGGTFSCIYSIRSGFFKTMLVDEHGREQVTGFFMPRELLGLDGLGGGRYNVCAVALGDAEVSAMPYVLLEAMAREVPSLQRGLHAALARESVRSCGVMMLLGSMSAPQRVAAFLLNLFRRLQSRGHSGNVFRLPMTRADIGSYLGLSLETVSRVFSMFDRTGLLAVKQQQVSIIDLTGLEHILSGRWPGCWRAEG